jgi:two-component system chemotaxis response regulator CheB
MPKDIPGDGIPDQQSHKNGSGHRIIVIGGSTGGFEALKTIVKNLPAPFNGSIFIVWHTGANAGGVLANVLNGLTPIYVANAYNNEEIQPNRIYIAPPDHHLIIDRGFLRVTNGPKENRFRPAIDPLFRSASFAYGTRVVGVVLSGAMDDGTAGLWKIKQTGGIAIVQDPYDAEVPSMPVSALRAVKADFVVPVSDIAPLLVKLSKEDVSDENIKGNRQHGDQDTKTEIDIATGADAFREGSLMMGKLSPVACPECHGVLSVITEEKLSRFRCHTGHAFSPDALMSALTEKIEEDLYSALRGMDETVLLLNYMGDHYAEINHPTLAALYFEKSKRAEERIGIVRNIITEHETRENNKSFAKPGSEREQMNH